MKSNEPLYLGVDIGGTKVAAGLVTPRGEILSKVRVPMPSREDATAGLRAVEQAIDEAFAAEPARQASVAGIGIVCPGPVDPRLGVIVNPGNLPCWRNYPLVAEIKKSRGLPTVLDNDANAAALAEARWGAGAGYSFVFYVTIGTGIGVGIVLDGTIYHGRTGAAGEGGHVSIDYNGPACPCGKRGCIEALAAGPAVARRARERLEAGGAEVGALLALAGGNPAAVTAEIVAKAWRAGDPLATAILEQTADLLAIWLGNMIDLFDPDVIVVGGGMSELICAWFGRIGQEVLKWSVNSRCGEIPLMRAQYGEDSGIAGGAALCVSVSTS
ncbi:MAG: ROK family protein [Candidatus Acidiferrales bacterium]